MKGPQLIRLLDVVPITSARNAPGISPRSVIIRCDTTRNIDTVLFNAMPAPSFVIYSPDELIAEVPEPLQDAILTDIAVLSALPSFTGRSLIEFGLGARVRSLQGKQRLIQNFVRLLLRTTGSNIFHKTLGGGLYSSVGGNITQRLTADIAIAITNTKQQIIAAQAPYSNIPPSERLLSAEIAGINADRPNTAVYVTVLLTSHAQERSAATFVS